MVKRWSSKPLWRVRISLSAFNKYFGPLVKRLRHRPFTAVTRVRVPYGSLTINVNGYFISIAQLVEHFADNGEVFGSSPNRNIGNERLQDVRVSLIKCKDCSCKTIGATLELDGLGIHRTNHGVDSQASILSLLCTHDI